MNVCNDVEILNILVIFKSIINLAKIIIPVILVIFVILDIIKSISSADVDNKKMFKSISKRVVAAVLIFLVPTILDMVLNAIPNNNMYYLDCYQNATKENLDTISKNNALEALDKFKDAVNDASTYMTKEKYNAAYSLYEPARQEIKKVTIKEEKETLEVELKRLKTILDSVKAELKRLKKY